MPTATGVTIELLSAGPAMSGFSAAAIEADNRRDMEQLVAGIELRMRVERLEAAEAARHHRMMRKPKQALQPKANCTLSLADVAARLQVDRSTVRRYVLAGKLKGVRIGDSGPYRFEAADVENLLKNAGTTEEGAEELEHHIRKTIG